MEFYNMTTEGEPIRYEGGMVICPIRCKPGGECLYCTERCAWFDAEYYSCTIRVIASYVRKLQRSVKP